MASTEPGSTISHYRIVSKIGAGGMGEVYLAEDSRLDRKVALKLLLPDFVTNEDRLQRFIREAKAAAAISHPNIAHIYEVGEYDATHYIAMEYVDGDLLTTRMHRDKRSLGTLLKYLMQVADGLAKAHAAGIVHRDLKPDNIMVTPDGYAKILDFGLAKLIEPQSSSITNEDAVTAMMPAQPLSTAGSVMGTVGYMSPEQAQGKPVDQRSDIFSFGCILYESATGRRPFEGDSAIDTLHKIIYSSAAPITDFNPSLPADLQRIIRRCLAKEPDKRYQTIKDVANDLEDLRDEIGVDSEINRSVPPTDTSTASSRTASGQTNTRSDDAQTRAISSAEYLVFQIGKNKRRFAVALFVLLVLIAGSVWYAVNRLSASSDAIQSLAVMPFVNVGGNADVEYVSDGMTETLISSLSRLPNLNVKARSSVFRYKGKEASPQTIGKELNVQAILNGRVVQHGDQLTLGVELIDVRTENILWAEQYNRKQADLVTLQGDIARDVVSKLRSKLSGADEQKVAKTYTTDPEAYQLYLKGIFYRSKRRPEDLRKGLEYFQQAIDRDPNYAPAYVGVAGSYSLFAVYGLVPTSEGYPHAKTAAQKALEIDGTLSEAHAALADVAANYDFDWPTAEREFKRAIELNPNNAGAHSGYGLHYLVPMRRFDEAVEELKRAQEIEPLSLSINASLGSVLTSARRYDEAIAHLKKSLELDPNFALTRWRLATAFSCAGKHTEAIAEAKRGMEIAPNIGWSKWELTLTYTRAGDRDAALKLIEEIKRVTPPNNTSFMIGTIYADLGDKDQAFEWLNKAYENRDWMLTKLHVEPWVDNIGSDPRLADLVRRMGLNP